MKINVIVGAACLTGVALLISGCGAVEQSASQKEDPSDAATPVDSADVTTQAAVSSECAQVVRAVLTSEDSNTAVLDAFGLAAPQKCESLDELRAALAAEGAEETEGAVEFIIAACVAGDAWVLLGEPSVIMDTPLCREARAGYAIVANRHIVPAKAVFADDFVDGCSGWSKDRDRFVRLSCGNGAYHVFVRDPAAPQHSRIIDSRPRHNLSVETDATLLKPRGGNFEAHGVSCWGSRTRGYVFMVAPDASYVILGTNEATGKPTLLKSGRTEYVVTGPRSRNRIRGDCEAGRDGTRLTLYVNGDRVAVARDAHGPRSFTAFGLFVATSEPGTDVRFDDVLVRSTDA